MPRAPRTTFFPAFTILGLAAAAGLCLPGCAGFGPADSLRLHNLEANVAKLEEKSKKEDEERAKREAVVYGRLMAMENTLDQVAAKLGVAPPPPAQSAPTVQPAQPAQSAPTVKQAKQPAQAAQAKPPAGQAAGTPPLGQITPLAKSGPAPLTPQQTATLAQAPGQIQSRDLPPEAPAAAPPQAQVPPPQSPPPPAKPGDHQPQQYTPSQQLAMSKYSNKPAPGQKGRPFPQAAPAPEPQPQPEQAVAAAMAAP
ncbi:MAG: hypothetical protein HQK81_11840, partial [Desulfovibrionaceae bacterium]|nr:hypothetical protein [Desulfovibrionaceae bacterium]